MNLEGLLETLKAAQESESDQFQHLWNRLKDLTGEFRILREAQAGLITRPLNHCKSCHRIISNIKAALCPMCGKTWR